MLRELQLKFFCVPSDAKFLSSRLCLLSTRLSRKERERGEGKRSHGINRGKRDDSFAENKSLNWDLIKSVSVESSVIKITARLDASSLKGGRRRDEWKSASISCALIYHWSDGARRNSSSLISPTKDNNESRADAPIEHKLFRGGMRLLGEFLQMFTQALNKCSASVFAKRRTTILCIFLERNCWVFLEGALVSFRRHIEKDAKDYSISMSPSTDLPTVEWD